MEYASFFTKIIRTKTLCLNSACPQASTCRRFVYAQSIPEEEHSFSVFNPAYLSSLTSCPHYWSSDLVHYAKGFIHLLETLPAGDSKTLKCALISRYGRKNYYRYRKGELLLPPEEQELITNLVRQICPSVLSVEFDEYVEQ